MVKLFSKSHGKRQFQIKGRSMNGTGMGSILLGASGSASSMVNGPSPIGMLGDGLSSLHSINLRSEGQQIKKKLNNIRF
jgi:hypothetical protein